MLFYSFARKAFLLISFFSLLAAEEEVGTYVIDFYHPEDDREEKVEPSFSSTESCSSDENEIISNEEPCDCEEEPAPAPAPEPQCIPFEEEAPPYEEPCDCEEEPAPKIEKTQKEELCECEEPILIPPKPELDGIVILGQGEELLEPRDLANVSGIQTCGFVLPTSSDDLEAILEPYFYKSLKEKQTVIDIKSTIYKYFQENGEPFVLVLIPNQTVQFIVPSPEPKKPIIEYIDCEEEITPHEEPCECEEEPAPAPVPEPQCIPVEEETVSHEEPCECEEEPTPAPVPEPQCIPVEENQTELEDCDGNSITSQKTSFTDKKLTAFFAAKEQLFDCDEDYPTHEELCECEEEPAPAPAPEPQCIPVEEETVPHEEPCECEEEPTPAPAPEPQCIPIEEETVSHEEPCECEEEPAGISLPPVFCEPEPEPEEVCEEEPPPEPRSMTVLQLKVVRAKLGEVYVTGAKPERYRKEITTKSGEELYPKKIESDLNWINRQPFQRADVIYQAGQKPGTTDLILSIERRKPWRVYAGTDNTGVRTVDRRRVFAGCDIGMPYGLFSCQYTNSYDWTKFHAITGQYTAFLPWRHVFTIYGGYSVVHASLPFPASRNEGTSSQGSIRYTIPLPGRATIMHDFSVGGDFKNTNNTLQFSEFFPVYAKQVNLTQLAFAYQGAWEKDRSRLDFQAFVYASPGPWLPNMTDSDYSSLRPGATNQWIYGKGDVKFFQKTPNDFCLMARMQFQVTSQNLLPSEQFGIGGYDTVRGYDERQLNFDEGFIGNLEWRTPPIQMISHFRSRKIKDSIQFLIFFDYGVGKNHKQIPGESNGEYLMGVGPGARYTIDPWLACRLDWGFKLHKKPGFTGGDSEGHFSVVASY